MSKNNAYPALRLKSGREHSTLSRHPWIFSGALQDIPNLPAGTVVQIVSADGSAIGLGHFYHGSIAVKVFSLEQSIADESQFWKARLQNAVELRRELGLFGRTNTSGFRLVNAEGDGFPGLIVDLYGAAAVFQFQACGLEPWRNELLSVLDELLPTRLEDVIYCPSAEGAHPEFLRGGKERVIFQEYGLSFEADLKNGQKTGFFLDQRDNRALLGRIAKDRTVLNCFAYTGAFSVYALQGGAQRVTSVEISKHCEELIGKQLELNQLSPDRHEFLRADCLEYLHSIAEPADLIVLDPPAFIKHRGAFGGGIKGYETINHLALKHLGPGGLLMTFSCSQLLSREDFFSMLKKSALRAGKDVQLLCELHQAPCHPAALGHPEGTYLKGCLLRVR
ncbi:MAG: class I SAM-dependent rRNA methyltransferase [Oligoflexia bacterium]|nr:class I SAM-dependent rRNA methyltransferase [Oligoflexia bacterium]